MDSPNGMTASEIQAASKLSYPTVIKWLEVLYAQGLVDYRQVGRSKLWFPRGMLQGMDEIDIERLLKLRRLGKELTGPQKVEQKE
jgi:DNA-binding transcriptional ArsR family regulator